MKNKSDGKLIYKSPFLRFIVFLFFVFIPFELFLIYFIEQITGKINALPKKETIIPIPPQTISISSKKDIDTKSPIEKMAAPLPKASVKKAQDDLQLISGIGPKTREAMVEHGISSFAQIANMNLEELNHLLESAGIRIKASQSWIDQARQLK